MQIWSIVVGEVCTNCYIIADEDTKESVIIDPGDSSELLLKHLNQNGLKLRYILLTHGHFDHVLGVPGVKEATGAPIYVNRLEAVPADGKKVLYKYPAAADTRFLDEGDTLPFACGEISVMRTPGHTQGSLIYRIGDSLFTGDTIFENECGRCDLPGGSYADMLQSLGRLHDLPGNLDIYPGHGPSSNLDNERKHNPYMLEAIARRK